MNYEVLLAVGNILFLLASIPNILAAIKSRNSLKGFSFYGSILTFLGMNSVMFFYYVVNTPINMLLALPTYTFWGIVTWYNRPV